MQDNPKTINTPHGKILLDTRIKDVRNDNPENCHISTIDFHLYKPVFEAYYKNYIPKPLASVQTVFIPLSEINTVKGIPFEQCQNYTKYAVLELQNLIVANAIDTKYSKSTMKTPGYLYIHYFFVEPNYRQKAWSDYLWKHLNKWLLQNDFIVINSFAAIDPVVQFEMPKEKMTEIMKKMLLKQGFHAIPETIEQYQFTFDDNEIYIK